MKKNFDIKNIRGSHLAGISKALSLAALLLLFVAMLSGAAVAADAGSGPPSGSPPGKQGGPPPGVKGDEADKSLVKITPETEPQFQRYTYTDKQKVSWNVEGGLLILSEISGSIYTRPGDKDALQVRGLRTGFGRTLDEARLEAQRVGISISAPSDRVEVSTKLPKSGGTHPAGFVDYELRAPTSTQLRLKTVSGTIDAARYDGAVTAETVSGGIKVKSVKGPVSAKTTTGNIEISGCPETVQAVSVSGRIDFEASKLTAQSMTFETKSGGVTIRVPEDINATFEVKTTTGEIDTGVARLRTEDGQDGAKIFRSGKGGTDIKIKTVSGKVTIVVIPAQQGPGGGRMPMPFRK